MIQKPQKPIKPKKPVRILQQELFVEGNHHNFSNQGFLEEIVNHFEKEAEIRGIEDQPIDPAMINITVTIDKCGDPDITFYYPYVEENTSYAYEYVKYREKLKKYETSMELYEDRLREYEQQNMEAELAEAEKERENRKKLFEELKAEFEPS